MTSFFSNTEIIMEESIDVKIFPFFVFQIIKEKKALLPHS